MPLMIIDEDTFNSELSKLTNKKEVTSKVVDINRGRGERLEVPESLRKVIAEEALMNGHTDEIARKFDVSKSSVDAYKNNATSCATYNSPDLSLQKSNDVVRDRIIGLSRNRLMDALNELTAEKIGGAKARDIASIAKDVSAVVKNMEPSGPVQQNNTQVIVYRPRQREESDFEVITVNE